MTGDSFEITKEEAKNIQGKSGLVYVPSIDGMINISSISCVLPKELVKKDSGYLHDGTKVVKKFGQWVDAGNPNVRLSTSFYPELARDEVLDENPKDKKKLKGDDEINKLNS